MVQNMVYVDNARYGGVALDRHTGGVPDFHCRLTLKCLTGQFEKGVGFGNERAQVQISRRTPGLPITSRTPISRSAVESRD